MHGAARGSSLEDADVVNGAVPVVGPAAGGVGGVGVAAGAEGEWSGGRPLAWPGTAGCEVTVEMQADGLGGGVEDCGDVGPDGATPSMSTGLSIADMPLLTAAAVSELCVLTAQRYWVAPLTVYLRMPRVTADCKLPVSASAV